MLSKIFAKQTALFWVRGYTPKGMPKILSNFSVSARTSPMLRTGSTKLKILNSKQIQIIQIQNSKNLILGFRY